MLEVEKKQLVKSERTCHSKGFSMCRRLMQHFEKQRRSEKKCQRVEEVDNVVQIWRT